LESPLQMLKVTVKPGPRSPPQLYRLHPCAHSLLAMTTSLGV
jgi:hypothetical protein